MVNLMVSNDTKYVFFELYLVKNCAIILCTTTFHLNEIRHESINEAVVCQGIDYTRSLIKDETPTRL